ncbi:MAG: hypothetical protein ACXVDD_02640 [Polyangia bacterium]
MAQLYVALSFVQNVPHEWNDGKPRLNHPGIIADRISQMKPALFKFPFSAFYLAIFLALTLAITIMLWVRGMRSAMAAEPDASSDDE